MAIRFNFGPAGTNARFGRAQIDSLTEVPPPGRNSILFLPQLVDTLNQEMIDELFEGNDPSIRNDGFKDLTQQGISTSRPDLLAVTAFEPAFDGQSTQVSRRHRRIEKISIATGFAARIGRINRSSAFDDILPVGKFIQMQVFGRNMIARNVSDLVNVLKTYPELRDELARREREFIDQMNAALSDTELLRALVNDMNAMRDAFDIKKSYDAVNAEFIQATVSPAAGVDRAVFPSQGASLGDSDFTPRGVFVNHLGFDGANYERFTNTKVFLQPLHDISRIIKKHSFGLFSENIEHRKLDDDPVHINKTLNSPQASFAFNAGIVTEFGQESAEQFSSNSDLRDFFDRLQDSLPNDRSERMKLLLVTLSREFNVSNAIADEDTIRLLARNFSGISAQGDPFPAVLGSVPDRINVPVAAGDRTISTLSQFEQSIRGDSITVLPFEGAYFQEAHGRLNRFVPGPAFFVEPILSNKENQLDTGPLDSFTNRLERNVSLVSEAIGRLLGIKDLAPDVEPSFTISLEGMTRQLFGEFFLQMNELMPNETEVSSLGPVQGDQLVNIVTTQAFEVNQSATFFAALAIAADQDPELKFLLFRYVIAAGVLAQDQGVRKGSFFQKMINNNELGVGSQLLVDEFNEIVDLIIDRVFALYGAKKQRRVSVPGRSARRRRIQNPKKDAFGSQQENDDDPYKFPDFASFNTTAQSMRWTLTSLATSATSSTPGYKGSWIQSFYKFINAINELSANVGGHANGKTRFRSFSRVSWAMLLYDVFISLIGSLVPIFIAESQDTSEVRIVSPKEKLQSLRRVSSELRNALNSGFGDNSFAGLRTQAENLLALKLQDVTKKIFAENEPVIAIMKMYERIAKGFSNVVRPRLTRFDPSSDMIRGFREIQERNGSANVIMDRGQIQLNEALVNDVLDAGLSSKEKLSSPDEFFIDDDVVPESLINAMFSMLRFDEFTNAGASDTRIISVGIPAGFSSMLQKSFNITKASGDTFTTKQDDVVRLFVDMVDEQFDGLVFKPKQFLFELSRFVPRSRAQVDINESDDFDDVLAKMVTHDFSLDRRGIKKQQLVEDLIADASYDFLSAGQIRTMHKNHVVSLLLEYYIRFVTGLTMNEKVFSANAGELLDRREQTLGFMSNALNVHVGKLAGVPVNADSLAGGNVLLDPTLSTIRSCDNVAVTSKLIESDSIDGPIRTRMTEDMKTFAKLFSSRTLLSDGSIERARLVSPKLFEKILNVPVNASDFVIDEDESNSDVVERLTALNVLRRDGGDLKLVPRSPSQGDIILSKFFVTIGTVDGSGRLAAEGEQRQEFPAQPPGQRSAPGNTESARSRDGVRLPR